MKRKLLLAALVVAGAFGFNANAQEDITSNYLTNADLSATDGWTISGSINGTLATDGEVNTIEFYHTWGPNAGAEIGNSKDFTLSQTVTLPAGNYRIAVNALYREGNGNGTNTKAYIFAGTKQQYVHAVTAAEQANLGSPNGAYSNSQRKDDRGRAAYAFSIGDFSNAFDFDLAEQTEITLGFSGYIDTYCSWCILGPVKLYKYSLDDYLTDYDAKYSEADGIKNSPMNADVKSALTTAMVDRSTFSLVSQVTEAIQTLTTAINNANTSIAIYSNINTAISNYATAATALDEAGATAYDASAVQTKYNNGTYVTLAEAETELAAALLTATKAQTTVGSNWTGVIKNPSFESNFDGWSNVGMAIQTNNSFTLKNGSKYVEKWEPNGTFTLSQTITEMPAGVYRLSAAALARSATSAKIYAGGVETAITISETAGTYSVEFACDNNADVTIGYEGKGNGTGASWLCIDNFTMELVSAGLPNVTAVTGKMNADVAQAQTAAVAAYEAERTVANYNAASSAIAAAQASKDAYTAAASAIEKANALKEAHNFATADATTTFAAAITAISDAYDDNTLTTADADAAGTTLGVSLTGWHGNPNGAAVKYLNNGFSLNDFDQALYINTWSNEGEGDGSNFKAPFYEYWTGDANSLAEQTWTGTLTNLPNGLYSVSALVRVRAKDGTQENPIDPTNATGITFDVNGGTAVDVTEGDQIGQSRFTMDEYTAESLVKDGTLNIHFNVAADNNISWLSFKNVKYTKVRDLTPEEEAVAPTAIALYNGETEVTEPIALDATTNTVTLTPSYTPAEATEGITWSSSDANVATVANGVVTGISTGTATITATSTIDENVSATATVTVTFPETEVAASTYVNDGATRTVYTYGENLIKNGAFEYPNGYYGWKNGEGGDLAAANFDIATDGNNKYLKAKASDGAGSAKSISTGWAIESGKTYEFGYKVKASTTVSDKSKFLVVSMTNTIGNEEGAQKVSKDDETVNTSWNSIKYQFTNTEGYAYVQFRARWLANSLSFDDFYLQEVISQTTEGNVDYATDAIPTDNIGTGAFQYSQDAIDAANALVQGTATVAEVEAAYDAVTTLNAPAANKLYNVVNVTSGFTHANKALTFKAASDADLSANTTTMGWIDEPGSIYPQGVKFTAVEGVKNGYTMSYTRADGYTVYVSTGKTSGLGANTQQIRPTTDATKALTVKIISVGNNVWNLYNTEDEHNIGSNGDTGFYTAGGSNKDVQIQEAVNNEVSLSIKAANKYGTLILPFAATVPTGVTAYSVSEVSGSALTLVEAESFAANTPYIVYAETGATADLAGLGSAYTDDTYKAGLLIGVYANTSAPGGSYVLQNIGGKVAFYQVEDGQQPTVGANRAYLTDPAAGAKSRAFFFEGDDATAIATISALTSGEVEAIYTIGGARVNSLQKGVNIVKMQNGETKKVIVK